MSAFAGCWFTTFGPMQLLQEGERVWGAYGRADQGEIQGTVSGRQLQFRYQEPGEAGQGTFDLVRHGKFAGTYSPDGSDEPRSWQGHREFDGVWDTSYGRMRIRQENDRVIGHYEGAAPASLDGSIQEGQLVFRYREAATEGEGIFNLSE